MKVTNTSAFERALSHRGQVFNLLPGASVEVDMTSDEAEALGAIFDVTGEPIMVEKPKGKGKKED